MTDFKKKVASAIAAGSILLQLAVPAFADTTIEISGNGANSDNDALVQVQSDTTVAQSNTANITNDVDAFADTGNNNANKNTGGDVSIETGDASVEVDIANTVNSNTAEVDCCPGDTDVLISGNGADSDNTVKLSQRKRTSLFQDNQAKIYNDVTADAFTGGNDANRNTGGDVDIQTGDADVQVAIVNEANSNSARIGPNSDGPGSVSARIVGNGAGSDNDIALEILSLQLVSQSNTLRLKNKVDAEANTGENRANRNTGGSVSIETGDANADVRIDNLANFNFADLDCGCLLDVFAKIAGNGADSDNDIKARIIERREVYQDNTWQCGKYGGRGWWRRRIRFKKQPCNDVLADAFTGGNDTNRNTGDPDGDPSVVTGDAGAQVLIENTGNVNSVGVGGPGLLLDLPDFSGFSFNLNLSFNLADLLAALGLV